LALRDRQPTAVSEQAAPVHPSADRALPRVRPWIGADLARCVLHVDALHGPEAEHDAFAEPGRTVETHDGLTLPASRGAIGNGAAFEEAMREPAPGRMIRAHMQSVGTAASLAAAREAERPIFTSHEALFPPPIKAPLPGLLEGQRSWVGRRYRLTQEGAEGFRRRKHGNPNGA
jgi:hypothetical protein